MDIWSYLKNYQKFKQDNPDKLDAFVKSAGGELVSLHSVALALDGLSNDVGVIMDTVIDMHEERLRYIVSTLPEDIQTKIKQKFMDSEDDLFAEGE
jgi:hypothetical protein